MTEELERVAVHLARARSRRQIHDAAVEASELRRRAVALDLELLDGVDDRKERDLPGLGLEHRNAVEQVLVRTRPAAVDTRQLRAGRQRDAQHERRQRNERAAVQRQPLDLHLFHDRAKTGRLCAEHRRGARDGHLLVHRPDRQRDVEPQRLAGRQLKPMTRQRAEPRQRDFHAIRPGGQANRGIDAIASRDGDAARPSGDVREGDSRARQRRAAAIGDQTGHLGGADLNGEAQQAEGDRQHKPNTLYCLKAMFKSTKTT